MAKPFRCLTVFGTRPEAIKMAPLVLELRACSELETLVCVTAQHREMLDQVLELFGIVPDFDLDVMQHGQTLTGITTRALAGLDNVLAQVCPDLVFVHGDTTTTFVGALAAFYRQIPVGHVEAGLRSGRKYAPYPEELNRKLTGVLTDLHFAPTASARRNLLAENVTPAGIFVTGNTVIDALRYTVRENYRFTREELNSLPVEKRLVVVEVHRRENLGEPLEAICRALRRLVLEHTDIFMVFPVHKNPAVREPIIRHLRGLERVLLLEPLDVNDFHNLMHKATLLLTDSGGIQEEAPSLGRPVVVLREVTERPEAVEAGTVAIAGVQEEGIVTLVTRLLRDAMLYKRMAAAVNPYGDGQASARILAAVRWHFGLCRERPEDFAAARQSG
ncbi:MAG: UDP-N-acetylglucosamine 2-epimerase [Syntrophomonadaceae bacterium]|nr:UDP-N-acetylglucosamine 2-epimerase [Bacillota bacterium]